MGRIDRKTHARASGDNTRSARFIEPMLLLRTDSLSSGEQWLYELKFEGYRAIAFKRDGVVHLRSRNDNDFSGRYSGVVKGLAKMPDNTVIDGEVIAFDDEGRPSFNALQNYGPAPAPVLYYVFDVMVLAGRNVMREPLEKRRELLEQKVLPKLSEPARYASRSMPLSPCSCNQSRSKVRRAPCQAPQHRVRPGTARKCASTAVRSS
jgi:ATP-dependent DNA ligase